MTASRETLAAHLYGQAEATRQRHAVLHADIAAEDAAAAACDAEADALRAEIAQFHGWADETVPGGGAYRLSKAVVEERDRRELLEIEVVRLRERLKTISVHLRELSTQAAEEPPASVLAARADEALSMLERVREIGGAAGETPR